MARQAIRSLVELAIGQLRSPRDQRDRIRRAGGLLREDSRQSCSRG